MIRSGSTAFAYDAAGNRTEADQRYDGANRLIEDAAYVYTYDGRGNRTAKVSKDRSEATLYVYDALNRLIAFKRINRHKELIEGYAYTYDALNRRITSTHHTPQGKTTRGYLYDRENIVALLGEDQELLATITHHPGLTDTPLSITNEQTGQTYYYHRDHQGSITALTNEAGEVVESFTYDRAYGTILEHTQSEETFNPYTYTGREFAGHGAEGIDGTLCDLYYYRARYYDPNSGTFISEDPIGFLSGDFNWYRYVGNDPVNFIDPSGLIVAAIPFVEPLIAPAAEEGLAWGAKALAGTAIGSYIGNKIPIPHFTPHSLEDRLAAVPRTLRPAHARTFPHVKPTAKPTSLAKQMEAEKTKAKDGEAVEQTKEEDPCDDAKNRKEKFCKGGEAFKIGNSKKKTKEIIAIAKKTQRQRH